MTGSGMRAAFATPSGHGAEPDRRAGGDMLGTILATFIAAFEQSSCGVYRISPLAWLWRLGVSGVEGTGGKRDGLKFKSSESVRYLGDPRGIESR